MATDLTMDDMVVGKHYRIHMDVAFPVSCAGAEVELIFKPKNSKGSVQVRFLHNSGAWNKGDTMHIAPYNLVSCS